MPRNMSFALTTDQIRHKTKTVTRRRGWKFLKAGDLIFACVKCMGLKPGEKIERLATLRVVDVRREPLDAMLSLPPKEAQGEADREGFPLLNARGFVAMFCRHMGGEEDQIVTRIEFEYVEESTSHA